jgi:hypothetical protein
MIIELFITFEVILALTFAAAFMTRNGLLWGVVLIISGLLAVGSWGIEQHDITLQNTTTLSNITAENITSTTVTNKYDNTNIITSDPSLSALNWGIFFIGLIMMFFCIYEAVDADQKNK